MTDSCRFLVVAPLLILAVTLEGPGVSTAQESSGREVSLRGTVLVDGTDAPVPGARIFWSNSTPPPGSSLPSSGRIESDSAGRFVLKDLEPGRYLLSVRKDGLSHAYPGSNESRGVWVYLRGGHETEPVKLKMVQAAVITGYVQDASGDPVRGIRVLAAKRTYDIDGNSTMLQVGGPSGGIGTALADDQGQFRLYGLDPGDYYIAFAFRTPFVSRLSPRAQTATVGVTFYPDTGDASRAQPVHVRAGEEFSLATVILQPAPSARLRLRPIYDGPRKEVALFLDFREELNTCCASVGAPAANFGDSGELELLIKPGQYEFMVRTNPGDGWLFGRVSGEAALGDDIVRDVLLRRSAPVRVNVSTVDGNGKAIPAVGVRIDLRPQVLGPGASGKTDAGGTVILNDVPAGNYKLEVNTAADAFVVTALASGRNVLKDGIEVVGDTTVEIRLDSRGAVIRGAVTNTKGERIPGSVVALIPEERTNRHLYRSVVSDLEGNFELRGVGPGVYVLFAWSQIPGAAYRNTEFMKQYEGRSKELRVEKDTAITQNVLIADEKAVE